MSVDKETQRREELIYALKTVLTMNINDAATVLAGLVRENVEFEKENKKLKEENEKLRSEFGHGLYIQNELLKEENKELNEENKKFKREFMRLKEDKEENESTYERILEEYKNQIKAANKGLRRKVGEE